jgi:hypothetical protein
MGKVKLPLLRHAPALAEQPSFRPLAAKQKNESSRLFECPAAARMARSPEQSLDSGMHGGRKRRRACAEASRPPIKRSEILSPPGSLGEAFARLCETENWKRKAPGTQVEWERTWKVSIDPVFGDVAPASIAFEDLDQWYGTMLATIGIRESHRALKTWRALWDQAVVVFKTASGEPYGDRDLSLGIRRKTPTPRNATWKEGEAVRLVKARGLSRPRRDAGGRVGYVGFARRRAHAHESATPWRCRRTFLLGCRRQDWTGGDRYPLEGNATSARRLHGDAAAESLAERTDFLHRRWAAGPEGRAAAAARARHQEYVRR